MINSWELCNKAEECPAELKGFPYTYYSTGSSAQLFLPRGHKKTIVAEKSIQDPRNWSMAVQVARLFFPNGVRMRRRQSTGNVTQPKMLPEHIHIVIINQWGIIFNKEISFKPHYYGT